MSVADDMARGVFDNMLSRAIQATRDEICREARPYPGGTDFVRCAALVCEEAGEAVAAALDLTRGGQIREQRMRRLHEEATHTAAMAIRLMMVTEAK